MEIIDQTMLPYEVRVVQLRSVKDAARAIITCRCAARRLSGLEDDVAALLEKTRRAKGLSLKQIVNDALRVGLAQLSTPGKRRQRFKTRHADLGRCPIGSLDDVSEALAIGEGEAFP